MKNVWQIQEAKNRLSAVVDEAELNGPQIITRRGAKTAVLLSVKDYAKLTEPKTTLIDFFKSSPLRGVGLDVTRSKDPSREVVL